MSDLDMASEMANLRVRYQNLVDATLQNQEVIADLRDQVVAQNGKLAMADQLIAVGNGNNQLLADSLNEKARELGREIQRLQSLLRKHGISPKDGS